MGSQAHIVGEAWTRPNRCPNGHESAVRVQACRWNAYGVETYISDTQKIKIQIEQNIQSDVLAAVTWKNQ